MKKNAGFLVHTKLGEGSKGRTYHIESPVYGKTIVHVENEDGTTTKLLCKFDTLKIIGYID